jgi:glycosyltransferase involved in cell wall biosynthesis
VPEVVSDGITGFVCRDASEAAEAVHRLGFIDRTSVRRACHDQFSSDVIVRSYEDFYDELIASLPTHSRNSAVA